jgi:hypothetical protein
VDTPQQSVIIFNEPSLEFRYDQTLADPRHGLALFGPYDADLASKPALGHVVLGTEDGIKRFLSWSKEMNKPTTVVPDDNYKLWIPFPGFEAAFGAAWPEPVWTYTIDRSALVQASRQRDAHERTYQVVELYLEGLRRAYKLDERIGVGICIVPDEVWQNCRPQSKVNNPVGESVSKKQKQQRKAGQLDMFEDYDIDQYWHSPDFRRQLKARSMEYDIPLQIIRETTLRPNDYNSFGSRQLTPLADRKWNLATTLYYKCGGKPWRLVTAREGVCYIGIAFRRVDDGTTACCAAQMFLNSGDGIVFLGEYGPWYSPETHQFHLSREGAANLLRGVLQTYRELEGKELTEVFIHARSSLGEEEFQGFRDVCPENVKLVGIRVRQEHRNSPILFRVGDMPPLRGTFWKLSTTAGLLWGTGYKPDIGTYDGWETPQPLRIDVQYGEASIERVAQDILGLTKLNYNTCHLGDAEPVTVKFSDAVGEILIANPRVATRRPNFKFYI